MHRVAHLIEHEYVYGLIPCSDGDARVWSVSRWRQGPVRQIQDLLCAQFWRFPRGLCNFEAYLWRYLVFGADELFCKLEKKDVEP